jgi:hypothetical protein
MVKFEVKNEKLYINDKEVLKAWESFSGWFWFGVEKIDEETWFGFVQGLEDEWGYFSETELEELEKEGKVWEIKKRDLLFAGRR